MDEVSTAERTETADTVASDDADLRMGLGNLSELVAGHGPRWLEKMLTHVADFAVQAIPGADGSGLTLFEQTRLNTVVASAPFVRDVDSAQYGLGEGPCITAAAEGRIVRSGSLSRDKTWPRFGAKAAEMGVHSVLSIPLRVRDEILGCLNVYAHKRDAFSDRAVELGELFALPAAISVDSGRALSEARRTAENLRVALSTRAIIDQSLGILMSRSGCTPAEAFDKLRVLSQAQNKKAPVVAQSIVDQAVRRARVRKPES